jgi:hypothetical protein
MTEQRSSITTIRSFATRSVMSSALDILSHNGMQRCSDSHPAIHLSQLQFQKKACISRLRKKHTSTFNRVRSKPGSIKCQMAIEPTMLDITMHAYLAISREVVTTLKHDQKLGLFFSVAP